jgi:hypothetical protein
LQQLPSLNIVALPLIFPVSATVVISKLNITLLVVQLPCLAHNIQCVYTISSAVITAFFAVCCEPAFVV